MGKGLMVAVLAVSMLGCSDSTSPENTAMFTVEVSGERFSMKVSGDAAIAAVDARLHGSIRSSNSAPGAPRLSPALPDQKKGAAFRASPEFAAAFVPQSAAGDRPARAKPVGAGTKRRHVTAAHYCGT